MFYLGSADTYVYESKEFAGVTIIIRSAANPKVLGNFDTHAKSGAGGRRKSEFPHAPSNLHDKFEHGDKADHTSILSLFPFLIQ